MRSKKSIFIEIPYDGDDFVEDESILLATWLAWNIKHADGFQDSDRDADTAEITVWNDLDDLLTDHKVNQE